MEISVLHDRSVPILILGGRLDAFGASVFDDRVSKLPDDTSQLVLDFSGVEYLSSIGIRSLVQTEKKLHTRRGGIILAGLSPFVARILEMTGLLRQLRQAASVAEAVELAVAAQAAAESSTQHRIRGRNYRAERASTEGCAVEVWGGSSLIDATLEELGYAFGIGGFGSTRAQATNAIGEFVAAGSFAGVVPADGHFVPDFVLTEHPSETVLFVSAAIGFAGPASLVVEVESTDAFSVGELVEDLLALVEERDVKRPAVMGFVIRAEAGEVVGQAEDARGLLLVGVVSDGSNPMLENGFHGHGVLLERIPLSDPPLLDDLKGVVHVKPETTVRGGKVWVYVPRAVRPGTEKRLKIEVEGGVALEEEWDQIIRRLYSDCSRVVLTQLHGGYMAKTFRVASYDKEGRRLLPTVLKISTLDLIQREEQAHRNYVQRFILNNSTTIMGTASAGTWAALRYNFLGISGPESQLTWLFEHYVNRPTNEVLGLFDRLYTSILKPWYGQPRWEPIPLYVDHTPLRLFPNVCQEAERQFGFSSEAETIECPELGVRFPNPFRFLKYEYPRRAAQSRLWYQGISHGDLNMRNILIDERENLYVIDFSETRPRNIVSDFARLEPVLKFEMTRVDGPQDLRLMLEFEQGLAEVRSLEDVPPNRYGGDDPKVEKAYALLCRLRKHAKTVTLFETDIIPYWLAVLEWTFSVVCYSLPPIRKKLAAYSAAIIYKRILELEKQSW